MSMSYGEKKLTAGQEEIKKLTAIHRETGDDGLREYLDSFTEEAESLTAETLTEEGIIAATEPTLDAQGNATPSAIRAAVRDILPTAPLAPFDTTTMPTQSTAREWLIENWLPVGECGIFSGRGGVGKSRLMLQIAYALATGGEGIFEGMKLNELPPPCGVLFSSYEDDGAEMGRRMSLILTDIQKSQKALAQGRQSLPARPGGTERLQFFDLAGYGAVWGVPEGAHVSVRGSLTDTGRRLQLTCEQGGIRLLILDPSAAAFYGNENDRAAVRAFLTDWKAWARETGCAVLVIAHPPKRGGGNDDYFSGSTDWEAGARFAWDLQPAQCGANGKDDCDAHEGIHRLLQRKGNYAPPPPPRLWLKLDKGVWKQVEQPACITDGLARTADSNELSSIGEEGYDATATLA